MNKTRRQNTFYLCPKDINGKVLGFRYSELFFSKMLFMDIYTYIIKSMHGDDNKFKTVLILEEATR